MILQFLFLNLNFILFFITVIPRVYGECEEENGLYQCKGEQKCIPLEWLCDTRADCPLGDDEQHASCGSSEDRGDCEVFHFECLDPHSHKKRCARREWRCDGFVDCLNAVDEVNCEPLPTPLQSLPGQPTPPSSKPNSTKMSGCKVDEFECRNGECIARDKDHSDESEERCSIPPIHPLIQPKLSTNESVSPLETVSLVTHNPSEATPKIETNMLTTPAELVSSTDKGLSTKATTKAGSTLHTTVKPFLTVAHSLAPLVPEQIPLKPVIISSVFLTTPTPASPKMLPTPVTKPFFGIPSLQGITVVKQASSSLNRPSTKTHPPTSPSTMRPHRPWDATPTPAFLSSALQNTLLIASQRDASFEQSRTPNFKMSAEAIKEKPEHFSVFSQSNVVSPLSRGEAMEPIHPKIGQPIIPVNRFQVLIPLDALKERPFKTTHKANSLKHSSSETTTKETILKA